MRNRSSRSAAAVLLRNPAPCWCRCRRGVPRRSWVHDRFGSQLGCSRTRPSGRRRDASRAGPLRAGCDASRGCRADDRRAGALRGRERRYVGKPIPLGCRLGPRSGRRRDCPVARRPGRRWYGDEAGRDDRPTRVARARGAADDEARCVAPRRRRPGQRLPARRHLDARPGARSRGRLVAVGFEGGCVLCRVRFTGQCRFRRLTAGGHSWPRIKEAT
jgi:hypothetical protein